MRDFRRHPDCNAPDLGLQCLRAVTIDCRFDDRVRAQAERLLLLAGAQREVEQREAKLILVDA
jgi:hypothetical protein